ncbi:TPA: phage tail protein [Morganella morganii]|uniref:phage tail protein n=1 Tax=Morganella morganii TaxID=582 RepID=UPI001BD981C2|nr:phage tail protein [Morganella morganii]MBT0375260.1 phage tail protein [Morganella morganii subsp. morganii]MBT0484735.1 phage tail protein [Morganella morganii subsp. morganii]HCT7709482.1 phage tail protein [Morganella morganii]HCT7722728.1 phage tail protein [Morganella morganii]
MKKLNSIKDTLLKKIRYLSENPEKLYLFVDDGDIIATNEPSLSYEYSYSLNIILEAFPGDQNIVFAVVVEWVKQHQPDILANPDKRQNGIRFEADILNNLSANISIDLKLTERVIVKEKDGQYHVDAVPEPENPMDSWEYLNVRTES